MMHRAWSSIVEVPYCFSRSYVKFQGHTALKIVELTQIGRFRTLTPVWIHQWLWNVAQSLKQQRRDALLFSKVIHQISRSHGTKHHPILTQIGHFRTIGRSQLSNPSDLPCWQSYAHYKMALFSAFSVAMEAVTMATVCHFKKCSIEKLFILQRYITYQKMKTLWLI